MAVIGDLPVQFRPYFKAMDKGVKRMVDIVFAPETETLTKDRKVEMLSEVNGLISANIKSIEYFVRTGTADAESEMDAIVAKPLV